ncbi:hypothetical protein QYE76_064457 [Lolium multiflorum]|uniref:Uncharacterized protein n=1 Tax=Lolium multiflorum TaxID=4521 RepID=A0AAD8WA84_LOLMU|nr:hypothetical protein QYE76_064457 [Lolium multiflorum]
MTRRAADPTWSPWRFNAEVQEAEEDAAVVAEPAGVSSALNSGGSRAPQTYEEYRDMPAGPLDPVGKSTHTNRKRKWVNDLKNDRSGIQASPLHRKGGKGKNKDKDEDSSRQWKRMITRRTPSQGPREDHPVIVPKECYALVVSPRIDGYDFSKCLMDGGASLNIMYLETPERMNLTKEQLKHRRPSFMAWFR